MNIEIPFEKDITIDRFWEIAKDLFFTKTYYNENTNEYYTEKAPKKCSADDMNLLLVSFITLSSSYCDILSKNYKHRDQFYHEISEFIVGLDCYRDNLEFCIRKMLSLLNFISDSNSNLLLSLTQNYEQIEKNESLLKDIVESIDKNEKLIKIIGWLLIVTYKAGLFGNKHINYEDHLGADKEDEVNDTTATLQDGNGSSVNNVGTETDIDIEEEIENLHSNSAGYSFLLACKDSADSPPPSSAITSNSANTGVSTLKETTDSYSARIQEMAKLKQGNTSNESTDTRDSKLII
ncbi:unnamed protein product [[Candida] boidinii]|nr:unnamed protein product [[Candida] boidinii]